MSEEKPEFLHWLEEIDFEIVLSCKDWTLWEVED